MQQHHLFEYAVIRIVPRVEREEFLNAGVILYCAKLQFLQAIIGLNEARLSGFCNEPGSEEITQHLEAIKLISMGDSTAGPIAKIDIAARFHRLMATRSTIVQPSKVHPGFCSDPETTILRLYTQHVL